MAGEAVTYRVPLADPRADLAPLRRDILDAVERVLDSGSYILGREVLDFEGAMTARLGVSGAVGVGSGTDALVLAMLAVGVAPGDEVITVSHTAGATVAAVRMIGATPVLLDIDPETYCLDPVKVEAAIGPATKAILPVHLYGHPADLKRIQAIAGNRNIAVIEDCAQAQDATLDGKSVGSIGDVGCFSFYPTKNLGAVGDGGLVASTKPALVERARQLRTYGWTKSQYAELPNGRCSRLDEMQAAILNVKLRGLSHHIERRRAIAKRYNSAFADLPLTCPVERPGCTHVFHLYIVRSDRRDDLTRHLDNAGIMTGRHYPLPAHLQPGLAAGSRIPLALPETEKAAHEILSLPIYPSMGEQAQELVIESVRSFYK